MGAEQSSPVAEAGEAVVAKTVPSNHHHHEDDQAVEVIHKSYTNETESSSFHQEWTPPQQKFNWGPLHPSTSSLDSSDGSSSCQSPVPRSPESLPPSYDKHEYAGRITPPPPPPPPPPGPPPPRSDSEDAYFFPDCGQFVAFSEQMSEMTQGLSHCMDPFNQYSVEQFESLDPSKFWSSSNQFAPSWWETESQEEEQEETPIVQMSNRDMLLQEAASLELSGDLPGALECYNTCLREECHSDEDTALVHHKLGVLHWKTGDYDAALRILQKSMCTYQDSFGFDSQQEDWIVQDMSSKAQVLSEVLNSLGRVHLSLGQIPQATCDLKQALSLVKLSRNARQECSDTSLACCLAQTKVGLGMVQDAKGKTARAKRYYQEALDIYRCEDANSVNVASCLNLMGAIHESAQEYDQAMDAYTEALMIYRAQLMEELCSPVDVAVTLNNIGFIHFNWGEFNCAMTAYKDALNIMESVLGPNHRNVASTRHNIGLVHAKRGAYKEALSIFKDVLKCQCNLLGEYHADVAITMDSISNAYEHMQRNDRAIVYLEKSLFVRQRVLGPKHVLVAVTLDRLGKILMKDGDLVQAKHRFHDAIAVYQANNVCNEDGRILHVKEYLAVIEKQGAREHIGTQAPGETEVLWKEPVESKDFV